MTFTESDWDKQEAMLQLNVVALTHLTRLFLPAMVEQKQGRILNVASTAAFSAWTLHGGLLRHQRLTCCPSHQRSQANLTAPALPPPTLCPGPTASEFQERADMGEAKMVKGRKLPTAAEVAAYGYKAMMEGESGRRPWLQ